MEKLDEIKDIMWQLNLTSCNLIQYADKDILSDLLKEIVRKFDSYSDDRETYFPVLIDAKDFQDFAISLEDRIINYAIKNNLVVTDEYYKINELRKDAIKINDLDELRSIKSKIFKLEKDSKDEKIRSMKSILLQDYLINGIPFNLFNQHQSLKKYIKEDELTNFKNKIDYLTKEQIDINKYLELSSLFCDDSSFYNYLRMMSENNRKAVPVIFFNGEIIVDYDVQESLNYYMCNQRSGVFTLNFITGDTIYHRYFQNWYLEETHDIITTNVKSKRYYKDVNKR